MFDEDQEDGVLPLVYAEDTSRNGTFWNGTLITKGFGGILLSDGDKLRISSCIRYTFRQPSAKAPQSPFDLLQEREMKVSNCFCHVNGTNCG